LDKTEKILESWKKTKEERFDTVKKILIKTYGFKHINTNGSHFIFHHPILEKAHRTFPRVEVEAFDPEGTLTVPTHNNKVKKVYLKMILKAIKLMEMYGEYFAE
jgi:predicted RNA binding protein YcfA (HicA-like mRNA interferase family)